ncbi:DUF4394 domain-containing protein [Streptomyces sp. NPDC001889]
MRKSAVAASAALAAVLAVPLFAHADSGRAPEPVPLPAPVAGSAPAALTAVGLTAEQRLVGFGVDKPSATRSIGQVTGLSGDTGLVGIDFRVQDRKLYGVGDAGGVYTLDTTNARAVKVSQLTIALSGQRFGVDFNPAANRLRVISDTGQNLRHNIDDSGGALGTVADGTLTHATVPPATALGVTAAAYTNNDLSAATATTLFDLDTRGDRVVVQSPANSGSLAATGGLGVDAGENAGFDIHFSPATGTNHGYATLHSGGGHRLYEVDVLTGAVRDLGAFPARRQVTDIALPLARD